MLECSKFVTRASYTFTVEADFHVISLTNLKSNSTRFASISLSFHWRSGLARAAEHGMLESWSGHTKGLKMALATCSAFLFDDLHAWCYQWVTNRADCESLIAKVYGAE